MKLKFRYAGVEYSVDTIMEFTDGGGSAFWTEPLFHFYQDLDRSRYMELAPMSRKAYLMDFFTKYEAKNRDAITEKTEKYTAHWEKHDPQIVCALEDAFSIDLSGLFNDLVCNTSFCPISPRYLARHSFDNFFMESERGALGTAIHEIIHFIWFHVWQGVFHDSANEYETPHLKWILSEMAVEPIMRDPRLGGINPYYQHKACVYPYFYTMTLDEKPVLDTLYGLHSSMPVSDFMKKALEYCVLHERSIRAHIADSENS